MIKYLTFAIVASLLVGSSLQADGSDIFGNIISDSDAKYPKMGCCIVPTCNRPGECYKMLTCGHICGSGRYPPAEYRATPGYHLKNSYLRYDCRFGECRQYVFTCSHCPDPSRKRDFNLALVREDCRECYDR